MQWTHFEDKVFLVNDSAQISLDEYKASGTWNLTYTRVYLESLAYPLGNMSRVQYEIFLERKSTFIVINIVVPCLLIAALDIMVFWLPPESGEKIG